MTARRRCRLVAFSTVLALLVASVLPAVALDDVVNDPTFDDVPSDHTFAGDIAWLAESGITRGCNPPANTRFCPDDDVTRGQMAAFLVRALNLTSSGPGFDDTNGHTFEGDISRLAAAGITRGCNPPANTRFCPDDDVTRGQMAAFLVRALNLTSSGPGFDDTNGHTFEGDISRLAAAGITRGCNPPANTRFCPDDPVTRGQMAAFLHRALGDLVGPAGNGLIAFESDRHGGDYDIFVMNPNGSGVTNLTPGSAASDVDPAWSPDGSKIAFASLRSGEWDIFIMNADGSNQVNLTPGSQGRSQNPSFSPDGSRIVFRGVRGGERSIYLIDASNGGNLTRYEGGPEADYFSPQISPDGQLMGFSYLVGILSEVTMWTLAFPDPTADHPWARETVPEPLLTGPKFFEDFSLDGHSILFSAYHADDAVFDIFAIDLADAGTTRWTNLTDSLGFDEAGAEYSPDGSFIVYDRANDGSGNPADIMRMTATGENVTNLTNHPADDSSPSWQPVR